MNISFAMTTEQVKARTKTVTRRIGWERLKPGTILHAIEKGQGLKKGERAKHLGRIRVVDVRREPLDRMLQDQEYGQQECVKEGFPILTPEQFVEMFCASHRLLVAHANPVRWLSAQYRRCEPSDEVTRIEFEYVD